MKEGGRSLIRDMKWSEPVASPIFALLSGRPKYAARQFMWGRKLRRPREAYKLHLGCGHRRIPGFVNIDHNPSGATDYVCDITKLPCPPSSIARIETYHVIEHIPLQFVKPTLTHWLTVLRPGGTFVAECPDLRADCEEFLAGNEERLYSIFGRQRFKGDAHHWGYTSDSLCKLLLSVGFKTATPSAPIDYHAEREPCIRVEAAKG
jgi:hypothetical protein